MTTAPERTFSCRELIAMFNLTPRSVHYILARSGMIPKSGYGNPRQYNRQTVLGMFVACQLFDTLGLQVTPATRVFDWFISKVDPEVLFASELNQFLFSGGRYAVIKKQNEKPSWYDIQTRHTVPFEFGIGQMPIVTTVLYYQIKLLNAAMEGQVCLKPSPNALAGQIRKR